MGYINPYISNMSESDRNDFKNDYFQQGVENGYFIKNAMGEPYIMNSITIEFGTVDLTNPNVKNKTKQNNITYLCFVNCFVIQ